MGRVVCFMVYTAVEDGPQGGHERQVSSYQVPEWYLLGTLSTCVLTCHPSLEVPLCRDGECQIEAGDAKMPRDAKTHLGKPST